MRSLTRLLPLFFLSTFRVLDREGEVVERLLFEFASMNTCLRSRWCRSRSRSIASSGPGSAA